MGMSCRRWRFASWKCQGRHALLPGLLLLALLLFVTSGSCGRECSWVVRCPGPARRCCSSTQSSSTNTKSSSLMKRIVLWARHPSCIA